MNDKQDQTVHDRLFVVIEELAITIYWAAFEMYPPTKSNPVSRMTRERAWLKTSSEHRKFARFQATRVLSLLNQQMPGGQQDGTRGPPPA